MKKIYRHGDLVVTKVSEIPKGAKKQKGAVLLDGEATGHAHKLGKEVAVLEFDSSKFFTLLEMTPLVHEEHKTIELPPGTYKTSRFREYDPYEQIVRNVQD